MRRFAWQNWVITLLVIMTCVGTCFLMESCNPLLEQPYANPPLTLRDSDLAGAWETRYDNGSTDRLTVRADGTFKQVHRDGTYMFETPWNPWWLERFSDARVRLHLTGARYYLAGVEWRQDFYDPVADKEVQMVGELVLNVRSYRGRLVLLHMWIYEDSGYSIIGHPEEFRRVESPPG